MQNNPLGIYGSLGNLRSNSLLGYAQQNYNTAQSQNIEAQIEEEKRKKSTDVLGIGKLIGKISPVAGYLVSDKAKHVKAGMWDVQSGKNFNSYVDQRPMADSFDNLLSMAQVAASLYNPMAGAAVGAGRQAVGRSLIDQEDPYDSGLGDFSIDQGLFG